VCTWSGGSGLLCFITPSTTQAHGGAGGNARNRSVAIERDTCRRRRARSLRKCPQPTAWCRRENAPMPNKNRQMDLAARGPHRPRPPGWPTPTPFPGGPPRPPDGDKGPMRAENAGRARFPRAARAWGAPLGGAPAPAAPAPAAGPDGGCQKDTATPVTSASLTNSTSNDNSAADADPGPPARLSCCNASAGGGHPPAQCCTTP